MDNEIVLKPNVSKLARIFLIVLIMVVPVICLVLFGFEPFFLFLFVAAMVLCGYVFKIIKQAERTAVTMNDEGISVAEDDNIIKSYKWTELPYCYYRPYRGSRMLVLSERERYTDIYAVDNFYDLLRKCELKGYVYYDNAIVLSFEKYITPEHIEKFVESKVDIKDAMEL